MVDADDKLPELDVNRLSSQLSGCAVGCEIHLFKTLRSTMDEAKRMAENGASEGAVVIAEEQTLGRGKVRPLMGVRAGEGPAPFRWSSGRTPRRLPISTWRRPCRYAQP